MAYNNYYSGKSYGRNNFRKGKKRSKSERMAFNLGMEQRIAECVNAKRDSRVVDAFRLGYTGFPDQSSKSLW